MRRLEPSHVLVLILFFALCAAGCSSPGSYVWFHQVPPQAQPNAPYVIAAGDLLDVRVYNEDRVSVRTRVRDDGNITLPLVGDIAAAGKTPGQLVRAVSDKLQRYIKSPGVSVSVEEARPMIVSVVGEVKNPGNFPMLPGAGVLQALAAAGGLNEFAAQDEIFLLRQRPHQMRVRFEYEALTNNQPRAVSFMLQDGDVITVE